eukprot:9588871-Heterocapsa_arctica.AAC.1
MSATDRQEVIKLANVTEVKGNGAGTSTDTGGPTDAAVAHVGGKHSDSSTDTFPEAGPTQTGT